MDVTMDVIYSIIIIITLFIEDIKSVFMKQIVLKGIQKEDFIYDAKEASLLRCVQRCKYIDKNSAIEFKGSRCRCIRCRENVKSDGVTLSGIFVTQKVVKFPEKPIVYQLKNVALNKPARQSSTHSGQYKASFANDGKGNTRCSTLRENKGWWEVDLEDTFVIKNIVITGLVVKDNKALYIQTRLTETEAWNVCKDIGDLGETPRKITCSKATSARYERVKARTTTFITIWEFKIYALVPV